MATLGSLVVNLTVKSQKFAKGMSAAQSVVHKLAATTAAMGAASVVALAKTGDMFDKMSKRTGIAVDELSRFQFAAQQSGTDINAVEGGLRKMAQMLLNADRGASSATDTLKDLGISASSLVGKTQTQQFQMFSEALGNIEDPGRRAALTMQVFGKSGAQLLPLIAEGADGFQALADESDKLGGTVSKLQAKLGAKLTDAFNRVLVAATGLMRVIGEHLAPVIILVANYLSKSIAFSRGYGKAIIFVGTAVITASLAFKALALSQIAYAKAAAIATAFRGPKGWVILAGAAVAAAAATAVLTSQTKGIVSDLDNAKNKTAAVATAMDGLANSAEDATNKIDAQKEAINNLKTAMAGMQTPAQRMKESVKEFTATLVAANQGIVWDNHPLIQAFRESESGFTSLSSSIKNELAIMRGEATETGLKLQEMLDVGIDPAKVSALRDLFNQRDALTSQKENEQYWKNHEQMMKSQADAIYSAIETPADKLLREQARVDNLVKNGVLTQEAADKFIEKLNSEMDDGTDGTDGASKKPITKFAGAMQRGSSEALTTILKAGAGQKQLAEQKKTNKHLAKIEKQKAQQDVNIQVQGGV